MWTVLRKNGPPHLDQHSLIWNVLRNNGPHHLGLCWMSLSTTGQEYAEKGKAKAKAAAAAVKAARAFRTAGGGAFTTEKNNHFSPLARSVWEGLGSLPLNRRATNGLCSILQGMQAARSRPQPRPSKAPGTHGHNDHLQLRCAPQGP